jgi:penicillin amidase
MNEERKRFGGTGPDFFPKASNMWALSADRITEGQAAFHIGPQYGNNSPTNAFGVGLHGAGYNAVGTSHWGFPMVMWGANDKIGWGVTVGFGDTVDMFQLTLNPANPMQYRHDGTWKELSKRSERIKVKGGSDVIVEFLVSHYGEIDTVDAANNVAYARARTWAGREVDTLIAWSQMNKAQNWDEYLAYGKRIAASLNWFYIDAQNNIGTAYVGAFVDKDNSHDFRLPRPGDGSADWVGPLPFNKHPAVFRPSSGEIVNWNNKVVASWNNADYQFWGRAHHVDVIKNVVNRKPKLSLSEFRDVNKTVALTEVNFAYFKPFLIDAVAALPSSDPRRQAVDRLASWDGVAGMNSDQTTYDTPAYAIFRDWLPRIIEATLRDDLPAAYWPQYRNAGAGSVSIGVNVTLNALLGAQSGVPQTYDFFNGVDKNEVIRSTLQATVDSLVTRYGIDMSGWLMPLARHTFSVRSLGSFDVNTPDQELALPISMARGTSNHMVTYANGKLDYADVIAPGQSGFIAPDGTRSPHYQDQLTMYGDFKMKPGSLEGGTSARTLTVAR